jgi:hypothetical protein
MSVGIFRTLIADQLNATNANEGSPKSGWRVVDGVGLCEAHDNATRADDAPIMMMSMPRQVNHRKGRRDVSRQVNHRKGHRDVRDVQLPVVSGVRRRIVSVV